jgi:hypothetical protein
MIKRRASRCVPVVVAAALVGVAAPAEAALPSGVLPVVEGQAVTGKNIVMPKAAAISGRVTAPSGAGLFNVLVYAHNRSSGRTFIAFTSGDGSYVVHGLPSSSLGYSVCFNPQQVTVGNGYRPRCYKNTAWNGGSTYPSTATPVSVSLGHTHTGIRVVVPAAGAISGTIYDAATAHGIPYGAVKVFSSTGHLRGSATTNGYGQYKVRGLAAASSDRVCASASSASRAVTYHGKCWKNVAWNGGGLPSGTTGVSVSLGHNHAGVNFALGKTTFSLGSITGLITNLVVAEPLAYADVTLFNASGSIVSITSTDNTGRYTFSNLRASTTGYVVCAQAVPMVTMPTTATGLASRCYSAADWNTLGPPSGATKVPLAAGQDKTVPTFGLAKGAEIIGTVFAGAGNTTPLAGVSVQLFTTTGKQITSTASDLSGKYSFPNLVPASYVVCFDGRNLFAAAGYLAQCYKDTPWNGSAS